MLAFLDICSLFFASRSGARPNWKEERKLNAETFGVRSTSQYNRRNYRGGRGGYRGRGGNEGGMGHRGGYGGRVGGGGGNGMRGTFIVLLTVGWDTLEVMEDKKVVASI